MSDDYEERIREDWYYTYKAWDAADDRRRLERQSEITRLGAEGARLEREIERSEQETELQEWIDRFLLNKKQALDRIDLISAVLVPLSHKTEWRQELDRIDPCHPEAKLELESLLAKVRTFKSASIERDKWGTQMEPLPFLASLRDEKLKRKIEEARVSCLKSGLEPIESSLKLLVRLCEAVRRYL
jgi:hypothetical protein